MSNHTSATCQEEVLLLEEQHLDAVTGDVGDNFPGRGNPKQPVLYERRVKADADRSHLNNSMYLPPTLPEVHKVLKGFNVDTSTIPENVSYTFHENGYSCIM